MQILPKPYFFIPAFRKKTTLTHWTDKARLKNPKEEWTVTQVKNSRHRHSSSDVMAWRRALGFVLFFPFEFFFTAQQHSIQSNQAFIQPRTINKNIRHVTCHHVLFLLFQITLFSLRTVTRMNWTWTVWIKNIRQKLNNIMIIPWIINKFWCTMRWASCLLVYLASGWHGLSWPSPCYVGWVLNNSKYQTFFSQVIPQKIYCILLLRPGARTRYEQCKKKDCDYYFLPIKMHEWCWWP